MTREFTIEPIPRGERRVGIYATAIPNVMLSIALQIQDGHRSLEVILYELTVSRLVASFATWIEMEIEGASVHPHEEGPYLAVGGSCFTLTAQAAEEMVRDFGLPFVVPEEGEDLQS